LGNKRIKKGATMTLFKSLLIVLIGLTCGLLGSISGASGSKPFYRRILIPMILASLATVVLVMKFGATGYWGITVMSLAGAFSLGYGIPDSTDEGSSIGNFWFYLCDKNHKVANILTRATIGLAESFALLSIPIIAHIYVYYLIAIVLLVGANVLFGAIIDDEGTFYFFGLTCLWEEFYIYSAIGVIVANFIFLIA